jgi:protein gp37
MSKSNIEWTESTWNPIVGCSIVSPGCTNCYAMKTAARNEAMGISRYDGTTRVVNGNTVWTGKLVQAPESTLLQPLKRKKPTTYFVNSMSDLFHEDCPDAWIDRVFAVMALTPQHTFQVLTKRAGRMGDYFCSDPRWRNRQIVVARNSVSGVTVDFGPMPSILPLPNVWLGVSTERQQEADERIPLLLQTPAAVRFISAEPLLGHIDLHALNLATKTPSNALRGIRRVPHDREELTEPTTKLDWVIVGGESGPAARPMHPDWARSLRDQCAAAGVPFFFKQWGEWLPGQNRSHPNITGEHRPDDGKPRTVACWQDGGWGVRTTKNPACNYVTWDVNGDLHRGLRTGANYFEIKVWASRVSKARAGRLLDGVEHNGMPPRNREAATA